jgi:glycosyltransferase involved in cell wall biosynthesis
VRLDPDTRVAGRSAQADAENGLVIGIDATNLRRGGGRTHLTQLLRAATPAAHGVTEVIVWGGPETLAALEDRPWLKMVSPPELNGGTIRRAHWQRFRLWKAAQEAGCQLLFVPGGSYAGAFRPVVTMSRNMLPFEWQELRRFGWSNVTLKLLILRFLQARSYRSADGVIFLTRYARQKVSKVAGLLGGAAVIIPHGVESRFFMEPRLQRSIDEYSDERQYRLLYVSIIDQYKHTWRVVEAVSQVRKQTRWPLGLDLVGPAYRPALKRLQAALRQHDPDGAWTRYHGELPHPDLHRMYAEADLAVFASSCENMPNTLLECMAAGLPVACSNRGPMPEVLGDAGVYFDPEMPEDIAEALQQLIAVPELRSTKAAASYAKAKKYSWRRCAADTFEFMTGIARLREYGLGGGRHVMSR